MSPFLGYADEDVELDSKLQKFRKLSMKLDLDLDVVKHVEGRLSRKLKTNSIRK